MAKSCRTGVSVADLSETSRLSRLTNQLRTARYLPALTQG
jgi:hypothetical protein